MCLTDFVAGLQKLIDEGHGDKEVFYCRGSSGDTGVLRSAHISDYVGECGPFDLKPGEEYVSVYAGN